MNKILLKSIKSGLTTGIILIFFEMINLTSTLAISIEKIITGNSKVKVATPNYMILVIGIVVLMAAASFTSKNNNFGAKPTLAKKLLAGVVIGLVSGGMLSILNGILSYFVENGTDIRTYIEPLSPDVIRNFLFQTDIQTAVMIYFITTLSGAILGTLISYLFQTTGQPAGFFRSVKKGYSKLSSEHIGDKNPAIKKVLIILLILFVLVLPLMINAYTISVLGLVCIYAILGLGLNLIVGLSGQLVFGYAAFYAIGAYSFALMTAPKPLGIEMSFIPAFIIALVMSGISGVLVGLPIMNLRGDYLAIVTLGFAEIIRILINSNNLTDFTGGPQGVKDIGQPGQPAFIASLFGGPLKNNVWFLYIIFFVLLVTIYVVYRLQYSRAGRSWEAMRDDETVAQACGVTTSSYKVLAIVIGAIIAGAAGAIYASRNTYTGPGEYVFMVSVNVLAIVVIGGMGSIPGVLLGAFIIKGIPELLRDLDSYRMIVFGALLVIMMVIRPEGLLPVKRRKLSVRPESAEILKEDFRS